MLQEEHTAEQRREVIKADRLSRRTIGMGLAQLAKPMSEQITPDNVAVLTHHATCPNLLEDASAMKCLRRWATVVSFNVTEERIAQVCRGKTVLIPVKIDLLGTPHLDHYASGFKYSDFLQKIYAITPAVIIQVYTEPKNILSIAIALAGPLRS